MTGSQTLTTNLNTLANSTVTFSTGADQFTKGLSSYVSAIEQLHIGLGTFNSGLQVIQMLSHKLTLDLNN